MTKNNERGVGNVMVLAGIGVALVIWFIFSTIMSAIASSQSDKREKMNAYFAAQQPKKEVKVRREVKGYRLSY